MPGPLEGIRVLEISQIVVGPYCGMMLADLGADVLKIEPPGGEGGRLIGGFMPGESKSYHALNRGKRSLVLDLQRPEAQALVQRVIPHFDVFIINSRAGVPGRLGVDYETLAKSRPDLVYMENTGYGDEGPSAQRAGSDIVAQAYSGLMAGEGKVNEFGAPRQITSTAIGDFATGLAAAMGICAALYRRALSGRGDHIKTSLLATALSIQSGTVGRLPVSDEIYQRPLLEEVERLRAAGAPWADIVKARDARRRTGGAFANYYNTYRVKDGAITLGALTPRNQQQIRDVLGITEDPMLHPDFNAADPAWAAKVEALATDIRARMLTRTMDEWIEAFDAAGAPASKVNIPEDLADDPQVRAMGYMIEVDHSITGPERWPGAVTRHANFPTGTSRPAPALGQHTDESLLELGLTAEEVAELRRCGAAE
ncbi:MAG: CoA transferase [Dehalococcoidia bacterium]|nr:CoA transferase [Dehalococcoidia bacterium]